MSVNSIKLNPDIGVKSEKIPKCLGKNVRISCLDPNFIVNPNLPELIARFGKYFFNGQWYEYRYGHRAHYSFNLSIFKALLPKICFENYENHFVIDTRTGEIYPIYICVPCGHCLLCQEKKINAFVNRIKYESFCYSDKPYFATLTYNNQWLPSDGVSVRDCQLFFKRLRRRLECSGFRQRIRYAIVSEYGKLGRAHYHAIIFGLPSSDDVYVRRISELINLSWSRGYTMVRTIDMRDNHTAYYTAKYMRKYSNKPSGKRSLFQCSSRRNGGIGAPYFLEQARMLRKRVCTDPSVLNPFTGHVEKFKWSKYAIDKIYPSEKRAVPLKLRKALKQYVLSYSLIKHFENNLLWLFETNYKKIHDKFEDLFYIPLDGLKLDEIPSYYYYTAGEIYTSEKVILGYLDTDFSDVHRVNDMRTFLLSNLQLSQCEVDLVQKVAKIKRNIKRLEKLEVL